MSRKIAIVLRGPPCGGKTSVACEVARQLASPVTFISLDDGWSHGEQRFKNDGRYSDLASDVQTLIVELGFGEPVGESFAGATRDPNAWLKILRESGRSVFLFLLQPPLEETFRRIARDRPGHSHQYFRCAALRYESGGVCSRDAFRERIGHAYAERTIDTSEETKEATARRIVEEIDHV